MATRMVAMWIPVVLMTAGVAVAAPTPLAATNTWTGSIADESLARAMPEHGVITDRATFEKLAKAWTFTDDTSLVDFSREIAIAVKTKGSTLRLNATLAGDGDVTTVAAASRDFAPGFRYIVISVPKQGIKTVDHRRLPQTAGGAASDDPGYDEPHGDWEYAVLDGPSRRVLARGRIDSCIECHAAYAATDHVTRAYMTPR